MPNNKLAMSRHRVSPWTTLELKSDACCAEFLCLTVVNFIVMLKRLCLRSMINVAGRVDHVLPMS